MEYRIVEASTTAALCLEVASLIGQGWAPLGSASIDRLSAFEIRVRQAMTRTVTRATTVQHQPPAAVSEDSKEESHGSIVRLREPSLK